MRRVFWRALLLALILAIPPSVAGENSTFHMFASVGTGETNGIYYPLGGVICGIVNQNLHESGVRCSRATTPGSVYNVDALRDRELEFALVQSDVAYDAYHGTAAYSETPFPALRGNALCKGSIDARLLVLGHPSGKVRDLLAGCALNLVPVDGPAIDSLVAAAPYLKKGRIPANAYGLSADVPSFGVSAILMTTADMDSRAVSDFVSSLGTQIKVPQNKSPVLANLSAQEMITEEVPAPLHPAALEAYRKLGLLK